MRPALSHGSLPRRRKAKRKVNAPPNTVPWPPILYLAAVALALVLHWLAPMRWFEGPLRLGLAVLGACGLCAGLVLEIVTIQAFRRHQTTVLPHRAASRLITDGPFSRSRNPIYLGNTILVSSAGLLFGIAWLIAAAFAGAFAVQKLAIEREERHLHQTFGDDWLAYAQRTPRWLRPFARQAKA